MTERPAPWPQYLPETAGEVQKLLRSGAVFDYAGAGPVAELEGALQQRFDAPHALTVNSGTSAIFLALAALDIGPEDEVVVAGWTFLSAITPLLWLGAVPVLADVAAGQPVATTETIRNVLTPRTRAVIVTHLFGEPVDTNGLHGLLAPLGIPLVEDCSHAHASDVGGRPPGAWADAAIFSLGARKIVSGGHGGVLVTRNRELYETALMIGHNKPRTRREFAGTPEASHAELALGGNLRMSPVSAVLALDHLTRMDNLSAARIENAKVLSEALAPHLLPLRSQAPGENRTYFDLVWVLPQGHGPDSRDALIAAMNRYGIPAQAVPTRPLSRTLRAVEARVRPHSGRFWPQLQSWAGAGTVLPEAEALHERAMSLPSELFHEPGAPYARRVGQAIREASTAGGEFWKI
jgi:perosamine synthetase